MLATLRFRREHCVRYRFRYSECARCVDACPHGAIKAGEAGVEADPATCRNCGLCATACHTEAIVATNTGTTALLERAGGGTNLAIACGPSRDKGDAIVPCLGALDAVTLAALGRRGIAIELRGSHHCEECEHAPLGGQRLRVNLEGAERLRETAREPGWARPVIPEGNRPAAEPEQGAGRKPPHDASRRHLFRRFLGRGAAAIAASTHTPESPAPLQAIRVGPPVAMDRRELLRTVWPRADDMNAEIGAHEALPLGHLVLDRRRCTSCEACARACPTAAIEVGESAVGWALVWRASRCVACEVCVEACQAKALALAERLPAKVLAARTPVTMHALPKKRCMRCDRFFLDPAGSDHCPTCLGDDADLEALFG